MRGRSICWSFTILLLAGVAAAAPVGAQSESGAPVAGELPQLPIAGAGFVSDAADDGSAFAVAISAPDGARLEAEAQAEEPDSVAGPLASDYLARLAQERRTDAVIQLELARGLDTAVVGRATDAESAWTAARFDDAIDAVRALEADGVRVDVAVSFPNAPSVLGPTLGSNVMVSATVVGETPIDTAVDVDRHSGNLMVVARSAGYFALYRSTNGGNSWAETASWCCTPGSTDLAVAATWGYVVYDVPGSSEVRMRRVFGTSGAWDATYFWKPVGVHAGVTVREIVMEGNADVYDNRIYAAANLSNGTIAWWWSDAVVGETFFRTDPVVTDIAGGLAMSYDHGYYDAATPYLYLSYRSTAGSAWVLPRSNTGWGAGSMVATDIYPATSTSVSAYDSTVLVGYCQSVPDGVGAYYRISYNAGGTWSQGTLFAPADGGNFFNPLVSARSGTGTAALVQEEAGTFDPLKFKQRFNYAAGGWSAAQVLNDVDILSGTASIDFEYLHTGWGMSYLAEPGPIWFGLSRAIYYSGFERGNLADWLAAAW